MSAPDEKVYTERELQLRVSVAVMEERIRNRDDALKLAKSNATSQFAAVLSLVVSLAAVALGFVLRQ